MSTPDKRRRKAHNAAVAVAGSETLSVDACAMQVPLDPTVVEGATKQLLAKGLSNGFFAVDPIITYDTDDHAVATIDNTGLLTAVAPGTCNVIATCNGHASPGLQITVTENNVPASVTIAPANPTIAHTTTQQFTATVKNAQNRTLAVNNGVTWQSDTPAKATIDGTGLATGVAAGTTQITATTINGIVSAAQTLTLT